jgi:predicted O-methyltransferase YrrM
VVRAALRGTGSRRRDESPLNAQHSKAQSKAERFLAGLPELFEDFPRSEHPLDRRLAPVAEQVENLARENNLALLNYAASCLAPDEAYVEVGVYHGASLIAAMLGNEYRRFVGIDNFEFRGSSPDRVKENLARFRLPLPELLVGDAFELVRGGALDGTQVGVWYYDAPHTYEAQLEGMRIVEPLLAPGALLIVDDTDWEQVERAMDDYLEEQPRARRVLTIEGKDRGAPQWWEGMQVLEWTGSTA